jgi:hypothetical protein
MPPSLYPNDKKPVESSTSTTTEEQIMSRPSSHQHEHQYDLEKQDEIVYEDGKPHINPLSTVTTESVIPTPPDGGIHAWLKVFGGFFIYVNIWSVSNPTHHALIDII